MLIGFGVEHDEPATSWARIDRLASMGFSSLSSGTAATRASWGQRDWLGIDRATMGESPLREYITFADREEVFLRTREAVYAETDGDSSTVGVAGLGIRKKRKKREGELLDWDKEVTDTIRLSAIYNPLHKEVDNLIYISQLFRHFRMSLYDFPEITVFSSNSFGWVRIALKIIIELTAKMRHAWKDPKEVKWEMKLAWDRANGIERNEDEDPADVLMVAPPVEFKMLTIGENGKVDEVVAASNKDLPGKGELVEAVRRKSLTPSSPTVSSNFGATSSRAATPSNGSFSESRGSESIPRRLSATSSEDPPSSTGSTRPLIKASSPGASVGPSSPSPPPSLVGSDKDKRKGSSKGFSFGRMFTKRFAPWASGEVDPRSLPSAISGRKPNHPPSSIPPLLSTPAVPLNLPPNPDTYVHIEPTLDSDPWDHSPPVNLPPLYKDYSESVVDPARKVLWTAYTYYPNHFNCSIIQIIDYIRNDYSTVRPYDSVSSALAKAEAVLFKSFARDHVEKEEYPMIDLLNKWSMEKLRQLFATCPSHMEKAVMVMRARMLAALAWRCYMAGFYGRVYELTTIVSTDLQWAKKPPRTSASAIDRFPSPHISLFFLPFC